MSPQKTAAPKNIIPQNRKLLNGINFQSLAFVSMNEFSWLWYFVEESSVKCNKETPGNSQVEKLPRYK